MSHPIMVSFINWSYAFCFFEVSIQASAKVVSNSVHSTSSSSHTVFGLVVSVWLDRCVSWVFTQSLIIGPQMYVSAVSTLSKGFVIELCVQLTILYHLNWAQNSSARACVPSNTAGGMPHMPPFDGVGVVPPVSPLPPPPPPPLPHPPVPVALARM